MEKKLFVITEEEKKTVAKRTEELAKAAASMEGREGYYAYAKENGYTEEEARALIDNVVIPKVDEYNASCREAMESNGNWAMGKITESIEKQGMDPQEAAKYKLGVLQAVRGLNARVMQEDAEELLTEEEKEMLENAELTDEMIEHIDEALAEALENSTLPLFASESFAQFLEGKADEESVRAVTWELWQDEQMKYCAAAAMCIARHNGELPSISDETPDEALVLGACQGVDVVNIENKVSTGEMAADKAYKILKVIGGVALGLLLCWILVKAVECMLALGVYAAIALFGTGVAGMVACCVFAYWGTSAVLDEADTLVGGVMKAANKIADTTYGALKKGAKALRQIVVDKLPEVKQAVENVKETVLGIVAKIRQVIRNKQFITAKA